MIGEEIYKLLTKMIETGQLSQSSIPVLLVVLCILGFKYIFNPMKKRIDDMPLKGDVDKTIAALKENINFEDVLLKFDKICELINKLEEIDKSSYNEINSFKHDLEHIKQLLNQFHGHLLYSDNRPKYGNKEL